VKVHRTVGKALGRPLHVRVLVSLMLQQRSQVYSSFYLIEFAVPHRAREGYVLSDLDRTEHRARHVAQ
jgi:hypothetical protein